MSRRALAIPLMLALGACASAADPAPAAVPGGSRPEPASINAGVGPASTNASPSARGWAVSIIGTPFALAFKAVVCTASVVVAAPVAGFLALGVDPSGEGYQALGDGLAQNCGPPYAVSPYAAS